jgi:uncharacterized protein (DUF1330 family)
MLFSRSKVYEFALSSIKEQHINDFFVKYINNVVPIMVEYGGKFFATGIIQSSIKNKFPAKSFAILEWPSISTFISIGRDERMFPLLKERNQYLEFILEGCFYNVSDDIDFPVPVNKTVSLLLSNRSIHDEQDIRFQWISDTNNTNLSLNLYVSNNLSQQYDEKADIEKYIIQLK